MVNLTAADLGNIPFSDNLATEQNTSELVVIDQPNPQTFYTFAGLHI